MTVKQMRELAMKIKRGEATAEEQAMFNARVKRVRDAVLVGGAAALGTASVIATGAVVYHVAKFAAKHWLLSSAVACAGVGVGVGVKAQRDGVKLQDLTNPE